MLETSTYLPKVERLSFGQDAQWRLPASILDLNPHPVLCFDTSGQPAYANAAAVRACLPLRGTGSKQLRQALLAIGKQQVEEPVPTPAELEIAGCWWQVTAVAAPEQALLIFYLVDITARRRTEQQLRYERESMQRMLDTSSTLFIVYDTDDELVYYNRRVRELMPNLQAYMAPANLDPSSPGYAERQWRGEINAQARQTRSEVQQEVAVTLDSGELRWYQTVRCPLDNPDGSVFVLGITTDITAVKRSEQLLARREKQYHDLLRYTHTLICTHDLDGRLLTVNPALQALLRQPEEVLVGRSISEGLRPEYREAFAGYLSQVKTAGTATGVLELSIPGLETERYLLYHNTLVEEAGQPAYVIGHSYDITTRIEAGREARRSREQAEANARAREIFLASMSHEVRTPLNGMLGLAAQLAKTPLNERQHYLLSSIRQAGSHLTGLLNDVLDISRLNSGPITLEEIPFELCESIRAALQPLAAQAREKGLKFRRQSIHRHFPHPWVLSDPYRLNQIIINLVSNAIKFTERGSIRFRGRLLAETDTELRVRFQVIDTGIGIAPEAQQSVFDDFAQASAGTSRQYGGSGLGLSISRRLARQMGGELTLKSRLGRGCCFTLELTLPKAPAHVRPAAVPAATLDPGQLAGLRVLLVEDNTMNREVTRLTLAGCNITLTEAAGGAQALQLLATQPFDVVLLDMQMPDVSGLDVLQRLRTLPAPARRDTPVIAFTATAQPQDAEYYLGLGFASHLSKPFAEDELYRQLLAALPPPPAYSFASLREFAQGNSALVSQIVAAFVSNAPATLASLSGAAAAGDWQAVARHVHHLQFNLKTLEVHSLEACISLLVQALHGAPLSEPEVLTAAARELTSAVESLLLALRREAAREATGSG